MKTKILAKWANSMKNDYHQLDQDSPPSTTGKDYYRVVEDGGNASFTAEECYKVVGDTPTEGHRGGILQDNRGARESRFLGRP
jgi:hypothetical protein